VSAKRFRFVPSLLLMTVCTVCRWDEWVPPDRLMKMSEENIAKQKLLQQKGPGPTGHGSGVGRGAGRGGGGGGGGGFGGPGSKEAGRGRKEARGTKRGREEVKSKNSP